MCLRGQIEVHSSSDTHSAVVTPCSDTHSFLHSHSDTHSFGLAFLSPKFIKQKGLLVLKSLPKRDCLTLHVWLICLKTVCQSWTESCPGEFCKCRLLSSMLIASLGWMNSELWRLSPMKVRWIVSRKQLPPPLGWSQLLKRVRPAHPLLMSSRWVI